MGTTCSGGLGTPGLLPSRFEGVYHRADSHPYQVRAALGSGQLLKRLSPPWPGSDLVGSISPSLLTLGTPGRQNQKRNKWAAAPMRDARSPQAPSDESVFTFVFISCIHLVRKTWKTKCRAKSHREKQMVVSARECLAACLCLGQPGISPCLCCVRGVSSRSCFLFPYTLSMGSRRYFLIVKWKCVMEIPNKQ